MSSSRFLPIFLCLLAIAQWAEAADGVLQAQTWDIPVTIPAGGYRSPKSVNLIGDWSPKIERGAVIDDIGFHGRDGVQNWKVEGAYLRKVRITGKRGVNLNATDTVLDECYFAKDDSWYWNWWSTRWRFVNCIFTKTFIRGDLPPLDFAARAKNCTFYNVNLPWVGMKENPAGYLGKGDMGFEKCRFVQCEVPETFLAGTVDCVFEGCQFQGKRHAWPKETTPIKVTAYYVGLGSAPKSFINGPLTVEFLPAPTGMEVGSTVLHSFSGGRVSVTGLPMPAQYTVIGSAPKKASEIPVAGVVATPLPGVTPPVIAPIPGATPPSSPALAGPAAFGSIDEIARSLPVGIELTKQGQFNVPGVIAANDWFVKNVVGKIVGVRLMVEEMKATKDDGYAFKVTGRDVPLNIRGSTIPGRFVAYFRAGPAGSLVGVSKNRELQVRAVVKKAIIEGQGRTLALTVTLGEAEAQ